MPYDKFEQAAPIERPEIIADNKLFEQALLQGMGDVRQAIENAKQRKFAAGEAEKARQQENKQKAFDLKVPSVGIRGVDNAINENVYKAKEAALNNNPEYFSYAKQAEKDKALGDAFNKSIEQIGTGLTNLEQKYGNAVVGKQKIADKIVNVRTTSTTPQEAADGVAEAKAMLDPITSVDFTAYETDKLSKDPNIKPVPIEYTQKKNGQDETIKYTTSFPIKTDKPIQVYQNGRLVDKTDGSGNKIYQYRIPEKTEDYIPFAKEYLGIGQQGEMSEDTKYFGAQYYMKNQDKIDEEANKAWENYKQTQNLTQTPEEDAKKAFIDARRQTLIEDGITTQMAEIMKVQDSGRNVQANIAYNPPKATGSSRGQGDLRNYKPIQVQTDNSIQRIRQRELSNGTIETTTRTYSTPANPVTLLNPKTQENLKVSVSNPVGTDETTGDKYISTQSITDATLGDITFTIGQKRINKGKSELTEFNFPKDENKTWLQQVKDYYTLDKVKELVAKNEEIKIYPLAEISIPKKAEKAVTSEEQKDIDRLEELKANKKKDEYEIKEMAKLYKKYGNYVENNISINANTIPQLKSLAQSKGTTIDNLVMQNMSPEEKNNILEAKKYIDNLVKQAKTPTSTTTKGATSNKGGGTKQVVNFKNVPKGGF